MASRRERRRDERRAQAVRRKGIQAAVKGPGWLSRISTDWIVGGIIISVALIAIVVFLTARLVKGGSPQPFFNQIFAVAVSPADANARVLGDLTGLYWTKNAGKDWDRVAAKDKPVYAIVADPSKPGSFLAAGDGFLLRSDDGGKSWRESSSGLPSARIRALAVEPASRQVQYAFLASDGLYRSNDAGSTWTKTLGLADATITSLAVKAGAPQTVFAMHTGRGFVRSDDGGVTFRAVGGGIPASRVTDVLTFAAEPQTVVAVSTGTVYRSTDGGENWQVSNTGLESTEIVAVTRDPGPALVFAADVIGGFYRSNDGGKSWVQEVPR